MLRSPDHSGSSAGGTNAPTAVVHTEQDTADLHRQVGDQLRAAGHPAQTIPAHELPIISDAVEALGAAAYSVSKYTEQIFGSDPNIFTRGTAGGNWSTKLIKRAKEKLDSLRKKKPV